MSKSTIVVASLILTLSLLADISAGSSTRVWTNRGGTIDGQWNSGRNWYPMGVPTSANDVKIDTKYGSTQTGDPIIDVGTTAYARSAVLSDDQKSTSKLTVNGTFNCNSAPSGIPTSSIILGYYGPADNLPGNTGTLIINTGGYVETTWSIIGRQGIGKLTMNGGTLKTYILTVADFVGSTGTVELDGGTINVIGQFCMTGVFSSDGGGTGLINITHGKLVINGDVRPTIMDYINSGRIIAYGGNSGAVVSYDFSVSNSNQTTVWADSSELAKTPQPAATASLFPTLTWAPGFNAQTHNLYFGTTYADVYNATVSSIGIFKGNFAQASYTVTDSLQAGHTYYWRVDEVNDTDPLSPYKGTVWSLRITAYKPTVYALSFNTYMERNSFVDTLHTAVCIQGIENRKAPRVLVRVSPLWEAQLTEPNGLCEDWNIKGVSDIHELINMYKSDITGVVLYDPVPYNTTTRTGGVNSTQLVATTVAGAENAIAVRKDTSAGSMYNYLVNDAAGPHFPVLVDLTGKFTGSGTIWQTSLPSTGSARCDAYVWAVEKYIKTGKCDPNYVMRTIDLRQLDPNLATQIGNLDYIVQKKGFCFELSPFGDEIPIDDPHQPMGTDLNTFKAIMDACNQQTNKQNMITVLGFPVMKAGTIHNDPDWAWEWAYYKLISAYNGTGVAQFCDINISFYSALGPAVALRRYVQNPAPTYSDLVNRGYINAGNGSVVPGNYVLICLGDYDCSSWVLENLANSGGIYSDPLRGQVYCNWGVDPELIETASVGMDYMYRHKTAKDTFMAWDSGAGYINPALLYGSRYPSGYPSGVAIWQKYCRKYYRMLDYSISGWNLESTNDAWGSETDCATYSPFSGDGIGFDCVFNINQELYNNIPIKRLETVGNPNPPDIINYGSGVHFASYRTILWTPSDIQSMQNSCSSRKFLDAYSFYYLMRYYMSGNNNYRATWIGDTIPKIMTAGHTYSVDITVRNDGWDTWTTANNYTLGYGFVPVGSAQNNLQRAQNPPGMTVAPGQTVVFHANIIAPSTVGTYDLYYDMVRENVTWFSSQNNIEWKSTIIVAADANTVDTDNDGCPDLLELANGLCPWDPDDHVTFDMNGFLKFTNSWLEAVPPGGADFNCDGTVNFADLAIFAQHFQN